MTVRSLLIPSAYRLLPLYLSACSPPAGPLWLVDQAVATATPAPAYTIEIGSFDRLVQVANMTAARRGFSWTFVLTDDLTWPKRMNGLMVYGESVTIDGRGHTLDMSVMNYSPGWRVNGVEVRATNMTVRDLTIVGFDGGGCPLKPFIENRLEFRSVRFVDVGGQVHPFSAPEPIATASDCWISFPIMGGAKHTRIIDCEFIGCSLGNYYSHLIYIPSETLLVAGCTSRRSGHPVAPHPAGDVERRLLTMAGNDFEVVPVPYRTSERKLPPLVMMYQAAVIVGNTFRWGEGEWHAAPLNIRAPDRLAESVFRSNEYIGPTTPDMFWAAMTVGKWTRLKDWSEPTSEWRSK